MIIVTGGAGMIGSNIVKSLNEKGHTDIIVVDNLENGRKFVNMVDCDIADYIDYREFQTRINNNESFGSVTAMFHEGACSATTEWDGVFVMRKNFDYTKDMLAWCQKNNVQFMYASSASTYGDSSTFVEDRQYEGPLNMYGYSKFLFDQYIRRIESTLTAQVVGFRYFNVYGPREQHKGSMASVAFHNNNQVLEAGKCKLFEGSDRFRRDFIYVGDVAAVNIWAMENPDVSGIFNLGTGKAGSFYDISKAVVEWHGLSPEEAIEIIPFPEHLKGAYQEFTEADMSKLRAAGCDHQFKDVASGVKAYLDILNK